MTPFDNIRNTPFGKPGYSEIIHWREMVKMGQLPVVDSICAWSDVCGFGASLAGAGLDLKHFISDGYFDVLALMNELFTKVGELHYKDLDFSFEDMDRCVVLNDGIAKVTDIRDGVLEPASIAIWMRNLIVSHWQALNIINERYKGNLGLKTVVSSGQRMQYMKEFTTGEDILQHGDKISEWGHKLLNTCFLFNPAQLQMNTAFARAYHIDEIGSKGGIPPNGFYIDSAFLCVLEKRLPKGDFILSDNIFTIFNRGIPALSAEIIATQEIESKLFKSFVHRIGKVTIGLGLESEAVSFDVSDIGIDPFDSQTQQSQS
jgi:hypothetical protein